MRRHIHIHKAPMKGRDALSHSQRMELQGLAKAAVGKKMTYAQFESSLGKRSMEEIEVAMRAYEAHETQAAFERRGNRDKTRDSFLDPQRASRSAIAQATLFYATHAADWWIRSNGRNIGGPYGSQEIAQRALTDVKNLMGI